MSSFYISHFNKRLPRPPAAKPLPVIGYVNDDISGDLEIAGLVDKNERDKKIIELFKAQLLLPIDKRSKALMKRFGIDVSKNGQPDAWPTVRAVSFHVDAYLPVDTSIHDNARLAGTRSKVLGLFTEKSTGNTYYFYFPLSISGVTEDNILKLDNFETWIYRDTGEPVPDRGDEYNLYHALYDQINNRNLTTSNNFLASLGMFDSVNGVTFTLRNRNIRVNSTVRNAGNAALNQIKIQAVDTPAAAVSEDELNQALVPVGEEAFDPFEIIDRLLATHDTEALADFLGLPIEENLEHEENLSDFYDPVEGVPVEEVPVEENPDDDEGDPIPYAETLLPTEEIPPPVIKGRFTLAEILNNPKYKDMNPFGNLGLKFPDYYVQFLLCKAYGKTKMKIPNFVIASINDETKTIGVVVHDYAHHKHITVKGAIDIPELFAQYNSVFISSRSSDAAIKSFESADIKKLKLRMGGFTKHNNGTFDPRV